MDRVENLHLVRNVSHINQFGLIGVKSLQRAARHLGVECARRDLTRRKVIEQGAGDCGLADSTLVGADKYDGRLFHGDTPPTRQLMWQYRLKGGTNHDGNEAKIWNRIAMRCDDG